MISFEGVREEESGMDGDSASHRRGAETGAAPDHQVCWTPALQPRFPALLAGHALARMLRAAAELLRVTPASHTIPCEALTALKVGD